MNVGTDWKEIMNNPASVYYEYITLSLTSSVDELIFMVYCFESAHLRHFTPSPRYILNVTEFSKC